MTIIEVEKKCKKGGKMFVKCVKKNNTCNDSCKNDIIQFRYYIIFNCTSLKSLLFTTNEINFCIFLYPR